MTEPERRFTVEEVQRVAEFNGKDWNEALEPLAPDDRAEIQTLVNFIVDAGRGSPANSMVARAGTVVLSATALIGVSELMGTDIAKLDIIRTHAIIARQLLRIALEKFDRALETN